MTQKIIDNPYERCTKKCPNYQLKIHRCPQSEEYDENGLRDCYYGEVYEEGFIAGLKAAREEGMG